MLASLFVAWASFGLSVLQLVLAAVVKFSLKPGDGQIGVEKLENSYEMEGSEAVEGEPQVKVDAEKAELEREKSKEGFGGDKFWVGLIL